MKSLAGKGALVTGSDGGIGFAIAEALADEGCNVVLNGPAETAATGALCERIAAKGVKCGYVRADVASAGRGSNGCSPPPGRSTASTSW